MHLGTLQIIGFDCIMSCVSSFFLFQTATVYPAVIFGITFVLNFFVWGKRSSGAVSYYFIFFFRWFVLSYAVDTFNFFNFATGLYCMQ